MDIILIAGAVVFIAVLSILHGHNKRLRRQLAARQKSPPPHIPALHTPASYKTAEEWQDERLRNQLEDVTRESVKFSTRQIMGRGEYNVFCAAMNVTGQPFPPGNYPVWVFPQVALGQIIRTSAPLDWQADHAHQAINSKRCDLLLADRHGNPIAVVEYQGTGHDLGGTAERRDRIKRVALERAGGTGSRNPRPSNSRGDQAGDPRRVKSHRHVKSRIALASPTPALPPHVSPAIDKLITVRV